MDRWVEETFHPHWRVRLEADEVLHEVKTEHQHLVIFENATWGTVLMLDGVCQLTTSDEFVYHEMMAHVPLMALDKPKRVLVVGGGDGGVLREVLKHPSVEKATLCEIDRDGDRHGAEVLSRDPRHGASTTSAPTSSSPTACKYRRRDRRALRRHHRRFAPSRSGRRAVLHTPRVLRRLQARAEGGRHPRHAERPAVPVPRPPARHHARRSPRCSSGWRPTSARSPATSAARSRSTGHPTRTSTSTSPRRSWPSARRSAASRRSTGRRPCTTPRSRCRATARSSSSRRSSTVAPIARRPRTAAMLRARRRRKRAA